MAGGSGGGWAPGDNEANRAMVGRRNAIGDRNVIGCTVDFGFLYFLTVADI